MFVEQSDGWETFPTATMAAGHALRELKKGQLENATSGNNVGGGSSNLKEGLEAGPSVPEHNDSWVDGAPEDAAGQAVHRGLLELERPPWLPDSYASSCGGCHQAFKPFTRLRHHCRMCGKIFCHVCCNKTLLLPPKYGAREPQRVCELCSSLLQPLQPFLAGILSNAVQPLVHDSVDSISLRSWLNNPWSSSLGEDVYKAANILQTFGKLGTLRPEHGVPAAVLQGARGLVLLSALRIGAGWSCTLGTGLMVARTAADGGWSAPCAVGWCGMGWGLQLGGELVDLLLVLRTDEAITALCSAVHLGIGGSIIAAAGPLGRHADAAMTLSIDGGRTAIYSYSVSRGAYLGVSVEGTLLATRHTVNLDFYGYRVTPRQILLDGTVPPPPAAAMLYDALHSLESKLAPVRAHGVQHGGLDVLEQNAGTAGVHKSMLSRKQQERQRGRQLLQQQQQHPADVDKHGLATAPQMSPPTSACRQQLQPQLQYAQHTDSALSCPQQLVLQQVSTPMPA